VVAQVPWVRAWCPLHLRRWRDDDLDTLAAILADPEVMRYIGAGKPLTRDETAQVIAKHLRHWETHGFGLWAFEEKATGRLIGRGGLSYLEGWEDVEVGWLLERASWRRGLATEAGRACLDYAFTQLRMPKVISTYFPENVASQRVMEKLGMTYAGHRTNPDGRRACWHAITQRQWRELRSGPS